MTVPQLETTGATTGLRFKLEKMIGRGSFGLVYRALQLGLNRPVALKVLHPDALENMEQVGRFLNEARLTASLSHPHIVEVIDHGVAGEQPWIAFELLAGPTLRALVTKEGMPWREALTIAVQVAGALEEAHRQGIIHRDVKPENVMQSEPGHFKVTDFGLAKWNHRAAFRTGANSRMGTPAYIAPELIATGKATAHSDQYALGVVLYELLTGQAPFAGQNAAALLERHLKTSVEPPSKLKPGIPKGIDTCVLTALAKNPRDRYAEVGDFSEELARVLEAGEAYTPSGAVPVVRPMHVLATGAIRPPSMFRQFWKPFVAVGVTLVVALALAPFSLRRREVATPAPAPVAPERARPASRLSAAEPAEIRQQLLAVLVRQDARAVRTKSLAALINPLFPRFADAAPEAASLENDIRADQRMLTMLRERMIAYYPEPELVPDAELALVVRVLINAARGWCWLENMSNTRETVDATLAAHGDQFHDAKVLDEMDTRPYSAGGEAFVVESVKMLCETLRRMDADPSLIVPELGDLITELYWLASVSNFRPWPAEAQVRLRETGRVLTTCGDGPLARAAVAVWQLGSVKHTPVKPVREAAHQALARLGTSGLPHARAIMDRVERELETGGKAAHK